MSRGTIHTSRRESVSARDLARRDDLPPQDHEAERAVLGAMMLDRDLIGEATRIIPRHESHAFYSTVHQELFRVLCDIYESGRPIDLIVVRDELNGRAMLDRVGNVEYLTELVQSVPSPGNVAHYAAIVRERCLRRELLRMTTAVAVELSDGLATAQEAAESIERVMSSITVAGRRTDPVLVADVIRQTAEIIAANQSGGVSGISTGLIELDDLTCGLHPGEMIVVAARPSVGKTAFGMALAMHAVANEGRTFLFYTLEMPHRQLLQRMLAMRSGIDSQRLRRGMLNEMDQEQLLSAAEAIAREMRGMVVIDQPGISINDMRSMARDTNRRTPLHGIVVDYMQLVQAPGNRENRQVEVATISRGLKALALELNIPVVALAQLNRNPEGRADGKPRMSDLRESGAIEQDADVIMLLHREDYGKTDVSDNESSKLLILVPKQRQGPTGELAVHFDKRTQRITTAAPSHLSGYEPEHRRPEESEHLVGAGSGRGRSRPSRGGGSAGNGTQGNILDGVDDTPF